MINLFLISLFIFNPVSCDLPNKDYVDSIHVTESISASSELSKTKEVRRFELIKKYGSNYGTKLSEYELELGMTKAMCLEICDQRCYDIHLSQAPGNVIYETWSYSYDKTLMVLAEDSGDKSKSLLLFKLTEAMYGPIFRHEVENSIRFKKIQFRNNKLILFKK